MPFVRGTFGNGAITTVQSCVAFDRHSIGHDTMIPAAVGRITTTNRATHFCARTSPGLARATKTQRRNLAEDETVVAAPADRARR